MAPMRSGGQIRTNGRAETRAVSSGPQTRESVERASQSPSTKTDSGGTWMVKRSENGDLGGL